jgi:hypothetical protein
MRASLLPVVLAIACVGLAGCESGPQVWPADRSPHLADPSMGPVKAGWTDDNRSFNAYLNYLTRFDHIRARKVDVSRRIVFRVHDREGKSVPDADVQVIDPGGRVLCRRTTGPAGEAMYFPAESGPAPAVPLEVSASWGEHTVSRGFMVDGPVDVPLAMPVTRQSRTQVPLDVAFVLDTTGSMGDELARLKNTLAAIHYQIGEMAPRPDVRYGMVLYRDRGDAYVTRTTGFADDVETFSAALREAQAGGGGDTPEHLEAALHEAVDGLAWRHEAVRLIFVLGDAPPHLDYADSVDYVTSMRAAARRGIAITTIGARGLDEQGEYIFRQIAQYTGGMFVFLTYGETGESSGGPGGVSHHTGSNWAQRDLDAIVVRSVADALRAYGAEPVRTPPDFFAGRSVEGVPDSAVLDELFASAARQIESFSRARLEKDSLVGVLSPEIGRELPGDLAGALGSRLELAIQRRSSFRLVERSQLESLLAEEDLARALSFDAPRSPLGGRHLPARYLVLSKVRRVGGQVEMLIKLVRAGTGEVLSATMLKIDRGLL